MDSLFLLVSLSYVGTMTLFTGVGLIHSAILRGKNKWHIIIGFMYIGFFTALFTGGVHESSLYEMSVVFMVYISICILIRANSHFYDFV
jgi:hypothetical protein